MITNRLDNYLIPLFKKGCLMQVDLKFYTKCPQGPKTHHNHTCKQTHGLHVMHHAILHYDNQITKGWNLY